MASPSPSSSPCSTCVLRSSGFCGIVLQHGEPGAPAIRQTFSIVNAGQTIAYRDEPSEDVIVLCYGWAANLVRLADGRRQILAMPLAGDVISTKMIFTDTLHFSGGGADGCSAEPDQSRGYQGACVRGARVSGRAGQDLHRGSEGGRGPDRRPWPPHGGRAHRAPDPVAHRADREAQCHP